MRLLFVVGLIIGTLSNSFTTYGADVHRMVSELNREYGGSFFVDLSEADRVKLKSETSDRIVWWERAPRKVFESDSQTLYLVRFDNLGQGKSVHHVFIGDQTFKVHLSDKTASFKVNSTTSEVHIALIKSWLGTFTGQPITNIVVVKSE